MHPWCARVDYLIVIWDLVIALQWGNDSLRWGISRAARHVQQTSKTLRNFRLASLDDLRSKKYLEVVYPGGGVLKRPYLEYACRCTPVGVVSMYTLSFPCLAITLFIIKQFL